MSIKLPKIFLDSGDPAETRRARGIMGTLDGQTTNPSLVVKNPEVKSYLDKGKKLTEVELLAFYKQIISEIGKIISGPISVEVYADWNTKATDMLKQADEMFTWGRNIYMKFPTTPEGVKAAHEFVEKGGRVNMTLVFDQNQAAAVYSATVNTKQPAFISPFIGRWDDRGYDGLDLVRNILKMYKKFGVERHAKKNHVEVLAASIRTMEHFYASIFMGADILTIPLKVIEEWISEEKWMPDEHYRIPSSGLKALVYQEMHFNADFTSYNIDKAEGTLLDEGIKKFVKDWKSLIG